jgi:hypothetical protein
MSLLFTKTMVIAREGIFQNSLGLYSKWAILTFSKTDWKK